MMSVRTKADVERDKAVESIRWAIEALQRIVVDHCWGHDDYTTEYYSALRTSYGELLDIRDRLEGR